MGVVTVKWGWSARGDRGGHGRLGVVGLPFLANIGLLYIWAISADTMSYQVDYKKGAGPMTTRRATTTRRPTGTLLKCSVRRPRPMLTFGKSVR